MLGPEILESFKQCTEEIARGELLELYGSVEGKRLYYVALT